MQEIISIDYKKNKFYSSDFSLYVRNTIPLPIVNRSHCKGFCSFARCSSNFKSINTLRNSLNSNRKCILIVQWVLLEVFNKSLIIYYLSILLLLNIIIIDIFVSDSDDLDSRRASSRGIIPKAKIKTVKMTFVIVFGEIICNIRILFYNRCLRECK